MPLWAPGLHHMQLRQCGEGPKGQPHRCGQALSGNRSGLHGLHSLRSSSQPASQPEADHVLSCLTAQLPDLTPPSPGARVPSPTTLGPFQKDARQQGVTRQCPPVRATSLGHLCVPPAQLCSVSDYSHVARKGDAPKVTRQPRGNAGFQTRIWLILKLHSGPREPSQAGHASAQNHGLLLLEAAPGSAGRGPGRKAVQ